jgi:hypothetical protein
MSMPVPLSFVWPHEYDTTLVRLLAIHTLNVAPRNLHKSSRHCLVLSL